MYSLRKGVRGDRARRPIPLPSSAFLSSLGRSALCLLTMMEVISVSRLIAMGNADTWAGKPGKQPGKRRFTDQGETTEESRINSAPARLFARPPCPPARIRPPNYGTWLDCRGG